MFSAQGFSWFSNDYHSMTHGYHQKYTIAECPSEPYEGFPRFNRELLALLAAHIP